MLGSSFPPAVQTVYSIEPNAEMREAAEKGIGSHHKFKSVAHSAERTELPSSSVDMVCLATAFHWFDVVEAKREWKRILRRDGLVFLVWNVRREDTPFLKDYEKMLQRFGTDYFSSSHRSADIDSGMKTLFAPGTPRTVSYHYEQIFDFEGLTGRLLSSSYAPLVGHPDYEAMMDDLQTLFGKHQVEGKVSFDYDTEAYFGVL